MTEKVSKTAKNDEKTENLEEIRSFLVSKLEEAKAAVDYYGSSRTGDVKHKMLAEKWRKRRSELQTQLILERISPEEFTKNVEKFGKRIR